MLGVAVVASAIADAPAAVVVQHPAVAGDHAGCWYLYLEVLTCLFLFLKLLKAIFCGALAAASSGEGFR